MATHASGELSAGQRASALRVARLSAMLLQEQDRWEEAEALSREVLEGLQRDLGVQHLETLESARNLARVLRERGLRGEAEALFRATLETCRGELGESHHTTLLCAAGLAALLQEQGSLDEALRLHRLALEGFRQERRGRILLPVSVQICWLRRKILFSRNICCFTRGVHDFMTCSCSETVEQPQHIVEELGDRHPSTLQAEEDIQEVEELRAALLP